MAFTWSRRQAILDEWGRPIGVREDFRNTLAPELFERLRRPSVWDNLVTIYGPDGKPASTGKGLVVHFTRYEEVK